MLTGARRSAHRRYSASSRAVGFDTYLLWRDGVYTHRWWRNLIASPFIYVAAGLLWNLEAGDARYSLSFLRPDWPKPRAI
jgi:hypothetical protein